MRVYLPDVVAEASQGLGSFDRIAAIGSEEKNVKFIFHSYRAENKSNTRLIYAS